MYIFSHCIQHCQEFFQTNQTNQWDEQSKKIDALNAFVSFLYSAELNTEFFSRGTPKQSGSETDPNDLDKIQFLK